MVPSLNAKLPPVPSMPENIILRGLVALTSILPSKVAEFVGILLSFDGKS